MYADIYENTYNNKNVYNAFIISLVLHSFLFFSYFHIRSLEKKNMILLDNIEIIEIEPDAPIQVAQRVPAQTPPKNVLDFIKMAMPSFKKNEIKELSGPEIESKIEAEAQQKLDLNKRTEIQPKPQISLDQKSDNKVSSKLSSIIPKEELSPRGGIAPQEPAIEIAEVGKVAVKTHSPGAAISFDKRAVLSLKDAKKMEIGHVSPSYKGYTLKEASSLSMDKRKASAGYTPSASIGYTGGISLKKYKAKESFAKMQEEIVTSTHKTQNGEVLEAKPDKKTVEIIGPVTNRKVITSYLPVYPGWARAKHIEADVVIKFFVSPEGKVREKVYIERTSGYIQLDRLTTEALQRWVFEPVEDSKGDQWGIITFRFLLK
ncbi:MAG: energy transducer TonB [Elusimicrobia bacterium]|nr:energy transducer TonB [Candidatus Liberimonas magnetica]